MRKHTFYSFLLIALAVFFLFFYFKLVTPGFLAFSDGAKFADVARNIFEKGVYGSTFIFFSPQSLNPPFEGFFNAKGILPIMPLSIVASFILLGISDFAVIFTSGFFYLVLVLFMFLLGRKLYGSLIGFLGAFAVASNVNVLDYATTGASETLFMFEIVLAAYLLSFRKKWMDIFGALTLIVMYFTRPHAFIFIAGLILYWLLLRFKVRKALVYFIGLIFLGLVLDRLVLMPLSGQFFIYSITGRGSHAVTQHLPGVAVSESLRGVSQNVGLLTVFKKVFYNLYNFYKLLPQIASPYMWALFVIGLFKWGKDRVKNSLKLVTLLLVIGTFLVTALTIPFFRYIHPVIPLVYFFATATLVWIVELMVKGQWLRIKRHLPRFISKKAQLVGIISVLLILFFVVGQALGVIFLDSRFKAARTNKDRPPVYVSLSWILKDNTEPDSVIITNLDTWGSWYGERKTVWFPLNPDQLKLEGEDKLVFDAIFLTSYLMDDENYYMGDEWRQVFYNPEKPENEFIAENYELKEVYQISTEETYEKQVARAVLLTRKKINGL